MKNLREIIREAGNQQKAIGHFNISDTVTLRAIFDAARELRVPVIIGTSEGEREFLGPAEAARLVRGLREDYDFPIFLNADHTHTIEKIKEAVEAGYDAVLFDAGASVLRENIIRTKEVVDWVRSKNADLLIEGEMGYIGTSSKLLDNIPDGAAVSSEELTSPVEAKEFVEATGVDLLAPAVGNVHGMVRGGNPRLDIGRIGDISRVSSASLVLHGGSGIKDEDFTAAIKAGVRIVHINTEVRVAWRRGLEVAMKDKNEVAPYKLLEGSYAEIKKVVLARLRLFNGLSA